MQEFNDALRVQNYYSMLAHCSMPATFAFLKEDECEALANADTISPAAKNAIKRISAAMQPFRGKHFISTDFAAPTDSPRFLSSKKGAVVSAESAWYSLTGSRKIRELASAGQVQCVCVRPFRVFDIPREFRLFIRDGVLVAMSQRHLVRHFRRLEGRRDVYWSLAQSFYQENKSSFPLKTFCADIYITSRKRVIVLDLNPWGDPTDPLMYLDWNREETQPLGCLLVPAPQTLSGEIQVSF